MGKLGALVLRELSVSAACLALDFARKSFCPKVGRAYSGKICAAAPSTSLPQLNRNAQIGFSESVTIKAGPFPTPNLRVEAAKPRSQPSHVKSGQNDGRFLSVLPADEYECTGARGSAQTPIGPVGWKTTVRSFKVLCTACFQLFKLGCSNHPYARG